MSSTIIGTSVENSQYVSIEDKQRPSSLYVIGSTGKGKSSMLENMIIQDIAKRIGLCLIDAHGGLVNGVISKLPFRPDNLIVIDIQNPRHLPGLNILECTDPQNDILVEATVSQFMMVFEKLFDITRKNPQIAEQLRNAAYTIIANPGHTMLEVPLLFTDVKFRRKLLVNVKDIITRGFWGRYEAMKDYDQREYARTVVNKFDEFLRAPTSYVVGQAKTTINFRDIMDTGKAVLIKLNPNTEDTTSLLGSMFLSQIVKAAFSRGNIPPNQRRLFNVYVDEFHKFSTGNLFESLLTGARGYEVATTMAHQTREQLDIQLQAATVNAGSLAVFRISGQNAEDMAKEFNSTPKEEVRIARDRALLSPIRDAITHLINKGHNNPDVVRFTSKYLVRYMETYEKYKDYGVVLIHQGTIDEYRLSAPYFRDSIYELNQLFYETMAQNNPHLPLPPIVVFTFASYYDFVNGLPRDAYREKRRTNFHPKFIPQNITLLCEPDAVSKYAKIRDQLLYHSRNNLFGDSKSMLKYTTACEEFITSFRNVLAILAKDPILVDTGQHEHIYERPRAYADVQNEIATRLANLDHFSAQVKLTEQGRAIERIIRTMKPQPGCDPDELPKRYTYIERLNLRDGYVRPIPDILKEIYDRYPTAIDPMTQALPTLPIIKKNPI